MIIKTPQQGRYTWIFSSWHAPSLCSRALLLLYIAPSYLFCYTSPDLSLKIFAIAITMLRLNPTQLRLEAQDLKWHLDRLDARRANAVVFLEISPATRPLLRHTSMRISSIQARYPFKPYRWPEVFHLRRSPRYRSSTTGVQYRISLIGVAASLKIAISQFRNSDCCNTFG